MNFNLKVKKNEENVYGYVLTTDSMIFSSNCSTLLLVWYPTKVAA